jgi:fluoroacetyl-CoA thioesterase
MLPPVPVTPVIVLAMENAALDAIRSFLEEGESAVGTEIDVHYLCNQRRSLRAPPVGEPTPEDIDQLDGEPKPLSRGERSARLSEENSHGIGQIRGPFKGTERI